MTRLYEYEYFTMGTAMGAATMSRRTTTSSDSDAAAGSESQLLGYLTVAAVMATTVIVERMCGRNNSKPTETGEAA